MPPSRAFRRLAAPVVVALAAAACATSDESPEALRPAQEQPAPQEPATGPVDSGTGQPYGLEVIPEVVAKVAPSVVAVLARGGEGSGVIWDQDGTIVTNAHVVGAADEV
ncbi:MAG TPA: hypothetical protein VGR26_03900, partial [Acidimicrobiales bacterium]|nr:hypothetical protein [Acidimicrobiales bacterium]